MAWQKPSLAGESLSQRESRHCPRMGLLARTDAPPHLAREPIPLGRPSKRPSRWENRPPRLSPSPVLIRSFMDVRGAPVVGAGCHVNDRRGALPWQRPAQQGREPGTDVCEPDPVRQDPARRASYRLSASPPATELVEAESRLSRVCPAFAFPLRWRPPFIIHGSYARGPQLFP